MTHSYSRGTSTRRRRAPCVCLTSRSRIDAGLRGTACEDLLLKLARNYAVPLITNEGLQTDGAIDEGDPRKLRAKGRRAGLRVLTPREFWTPHISRTKARRDFLKRYEEQALRWVKHHSKPEAANQCARSWRGFFEHVSWGRTSDPDVRLPVELPRWGVIRAS